MRKGFILPIIFLILVAFGIYTLFNRYAKYPNALTKQIASEIQKYPNSQNWVVKNQRNVCLTPNEKCIQPSRISFSTQDSWNDIYFFYKEELVKKGWSTKSFILTSIPTDITFTNNADCQVVLTQSKPIFTLSDQKSNSYNLTITCPD